MAEAINLSDNTVLCVTLCFSVLLCVSSLFFLLHRGPLRIHRGSQRKQKRLVKFQDCQECLLRNFYISYLTHTFFPFLLLL